MSYPFNYPTPINANVQIFTGASTGAYTTNVWTKPQGVSFVWFTLIGAGGNGIGGNGVSVGGGGGSGAVTNCLVPAFIIPDNLFIRIGNPAIGGNTATIVFHKTKTTQYQLLSANFGNNGTNSVGGSGGAASTSNYFSAAGLFQSVAGQSGAFDTDLTASATTFLSGGGSSGSANRTVTGNYGYSSVATNSASPSSFFLTQPIIVGVGGNNNTNGDSSNGAIGCGGGGQVSVLSTFGTGGPGMAVIISW